MADYDLRYVQEALPHLKDYLFSDELFWPAPANNQRGEPAYPSLTLGNLFYHLEAAKARAGGFAGTETELNAILDKWRTHAEHKMQKEFSSRLRQWLAYLNDLTQKPRDNAAAYSSQVRQRVVLALIADALGNKLPLDAGMLTAGDSKLKSHFKSGAFLWEADLQQAFSKKNYWYLYGTIPAR
ncbi:MAG: hypothetical protein EPO32_05745 [Anaerolineae bacterium]|nr:MAG: hypothetical protein EPO32_05745 [Anaerolineae bacterium]